MDNLNEVTGEETNYNKDSEIFENLNSIYIEETYQRKSWPFLINQHETNSNPNGFNELIKLHACVKEIVTDKNLKFYLKEYMNLFGFTNLRQLLRHGIFLSNTPEMIYASGDFDNRYPTITVENKTIDLLSLSIDSEYYRNNSSKNIYYKLFKERPLFKGPVNEYFILDMAFLKGKIYTGFAFDFYYQTDLCNSVLYPKGFADFKSDFFQKKLWMKLYLKSF